MSCIFMSCYFMSVIFSAHMSVSLCLSVCLFACFCTRPGAYFRNYIFNLVLILSRLPVAAASAHFRPSVREPASSLVSFFCVVVTWYDHVTSCRQSDIERVCQQTTPTGSRTTDTGTQTDRQTQDGTASDRQSRSSPVRLFVNCRGSGVDWRHWVWVGR